MGYGKNALAALHKESEDEDDDMQTVITQMTPLSTQSQLMATTAAETSASVAAAINQLATNQNAMQQQFAAFPAQCNTTYQPAQVAQPPAMQFSISNFATFLPAGLGGGRRGGRGCGGRANFAHTGGRNICTPHLPILSVMADKVACPPLVEETNAVGVRHHSRNKK